MALANFFEKTALGAAQILQGIDYDSFKSIVEAHRVGIFFDRAATSSAEGRHTLHLSVDLLARLYPKLAIMYDGEDGRALFDELVESARAINPEIEITDNDSAPTVILAIGATRSPGSVPTIYVGSEGWIVKISGDGPVQSGPTENPFGAGAAACFGAANVFRIVFGDHLPEGRVIDSFSMSLLDYEPNASVPLNPELEHVHLGETHLVGIGAIGSGAIWALSRSQNLTGSLELVDHEVLDLTNLQRYTGTTQADVGSAKVSVAVSCFSESDLKVHPHQMTWGEYLKERGNWILERVAVAVDSAEDRRSIQAALPAFIINSWTQAGELGVSRHCFLGEDACLLCLYFPASGAKSEDEIIAEAIGLPEHLKEVRHLLYTGALVERELIERIAAALGVPADPLLSFIGQPLRAFYTGAICGGVVLKLGGKAGGTGVHAQVPLAFQSALAGIMLAVELVAHAGAIRPMAPIVRTSIDVMRPLRSHLNFSAKKHSSGQCICQDDDYVEAYKSKYLTQK
jgi:molybdopterin/thiamine biosynthesis adenylyltransferase